MTRRCLLFTYGTLAPGSPLAPRSAGRAWPDRLRGKMFDLGDYPGAVALEQDGETWINGQTVEIDEDELAEIDVYEDVSVGLFARRLVTTESGHLAWAYEYCGAVPQGVSPLVDWSAHAKGRAAR